MKKAVWWMGGLVLIVGGTGIALYVRNNRAAGLAFRTVPVEQGPLRVTVTATGTLSAITTVQVGTQVSGTIARIYVDFNDHVRQGQVLAELDQRPLIAALNDAEAAYERAQAEVRQTERNLKRAQRLWAQNLIAQADYDAALSNYEMAVANLKSAEANFSRARTNLFYATITSPIDGVVVSRNVDVGQTVAASFNTPTLFVIANDLRKMQVLANVDEADIGRVRVGQNVTFTVDAYPDRVFHGRVEQIRLQPTVNQNVVTYTVVINAPNPEGQLLPGMTANVTVLVAEKPDVLKVPMMALRFMPPREYLERFRSEQSDWGRRPERPSGNGGSRAFRDGDLALSPSPDGTGGPSAWLGSRDSSRGILWVLDPATKRIRPLSVRTGLSDGTYVEVQGDLTPGMEVAVGMIGSDRSARNLQQPPNPFMFRRF
ncbi:MAG: efflux RND transporter periplasmic adaptor subunit [Acidobacteria bacterium]|nr:efflux RND transporter periplasmic adaptor subunit [Acidobacteriota bacterium]MDW7983908.1 efflux RND transporter periplasmic adaptor subunit [Acidobacteriota bacterium]